MRKLLIVVALASGIALLSTSVATASKGGDQKLADGATLQRADVPDDFAEVPTRPDDEAFTYDCEGALAAASEASLAAPHASSGFKLEASLGYAIINSRVAVLPKTASAKQALNAFQDEEAAEACMQTFFEEFLAQPGVTTEVSVGSFSPELDDKGSKKVIKGGDEFAGLSMNARRSAEGGEPQFFEAVVVIARVGRGTVQLTFVTSGTVQTDDVQAMTQKVVRRLESAR